MDGEELLAVPTAALAGARHRGDATVGSVRARWLARVAPALSLILAVGACADDDGNGTEGPAASGPAITTAGAVPEGFGSVSVQITAPDGTVRSMCLHLADTPELRRRGLMHVTDLDGREGMLFRYAEPHDGGFWMKDTVLPLSIAFFAADGSFVSATDMDPCPPGTDCPLSSATGPYTAAIEVPQGNLAGLGLVAGSTLSIGSSPC
jgi:uncharacterized membrane protein (UPF0127 family)